MAKTAATWLTFNEFLAEALSAPAEARQALVDRLLAEHPVFPWVTGEGATFVFSGSAAHRGGSDEAVRFQQVDIHDVAVNLDTLPGDPPFAPMQRVDGTDLWYTTQYFAQDDLLDYLLAINDPMTPLSQEKDVLGRVQKYWRSDPLNPLVLQTGQTRVSVLRMAQARPLPDWNAFHIPRGHVEEIIFDMDTLESAYFDLRGRRLSIYTPPDYNRALLYPLLIMFDGQWATGPLQLPAIADALIKHGQMQPCVIAMIGSATGTQRDREYIANDDQYRFLVEDLLPYLQAGYTLDSTRIAIGGVDVGALAAAGAALRNPAVFNRLFMISAPMGKGQNAAQLREYMTSFETSSALPRRIFHAVGRYEARARFVQPAEHLRNILHMRARTLDLRYQFVEMGSGHGLVGFKSVLPEALAWVLPGAVSG